MNNLYLELSCYTSTFHIGSSQFISNGECNTGSTDELLRYKYWSSERWDLGFCFCRVRENLSVGYLRTYKSKDSFNITLLSGTCCPWISHSSVSLCKKAVTALIYFACSYQFCSVVTPESKPASPGPSIGCLPSTNTGSCWNSCCTSWKNHGVCQGLPGTLEEHLFWRQHWKSLCYQERCCSRAYLWSQSSLHVLWEIKMAK